MNKLHKQIIEALYYGYHLEKKELEIAKNILHGLNNQLKERK